MNREERERCGTALTFDKKDFTRWLKTLNFHKGEWWAVKSWSPGKTPWLIGDIIDRTRVKVYSSSGYTSYANILDSKLSPMGSWIFIPDIDVFVKEQQALQQEQQALQQEHFAAQAAADARMMASMQLVNEARAQQREILQVSPAPRIHRPTVQERSQQIRADVAVPLWQQFQGRISRPRGR